MKVRCPKNPPAPISPSLLQSETCPFFLLSVGDQLELAARSRTASVRRKDMASDFTPSSTPSCHVLTKDQITELFQTSVKLASENKINQKNTWELKLIDHLSSVIKAETEADAEINFEKASCTLEAGVKIYSFRVDSAHSLAFKLLAQIIRTGDEDQQDTEEAVDNFESEGENNSEKDQKRKISPLSTVEQSFATLNMRKFDVTFVVDPDYHQKLIPYDEGGVQGLLLYNLGVYGNCRVLFDSVEDPRICISGSKETPNLDIIDLSSIREEIAHMIINMCGKNDITPTLSTIMSQFHIDNLCHLNQFNGSPKPTGGADAAAKGNIRPDGNWSSYIGEASCSYDLETNVIKDHLIFEDTTSQSYDEIDGKYEEFAACLLQGLDFPPKHNTWKDTDHWKYQNPKGSEEVHATERRSDFKVQRSKKNGSLDYDIKFTTFLGDDLSSIFVPPGNPKSLLLPVNRDSFSNRIHEDWHYLPEDLLKLFLCPNIKFFERRQVNPPDHNSGQKSTSLDEEAPAWDNENEYGWLHNDEHDKSHFEAPHQLVSETGQLHDHSSFQQLKVLQSEAQYYNAPKQADMHILKETLWDHIQESRQITELVSKDQISFKDVLATFPAAILLDRISPHLCFICLLHLANEHSLNVKGNPNLDDLTIHLPRC